MAVAVVAGCTDPCPPSAEAMWEIAFGRGRISCIVLGVLGASRGRKGRRRRRGGAILFHHHLIQHWLLLMQTTACVHVLTCPSSKAAAVFVASEPARQQQLARGWLPGRPAVGVQCAVHKMPISVGQRPRETKHGKCDLARDPNPATCKKLPPVIQIPESCASRFSRLNIALQ